MTSKGTIYNQSKLEESKEEQSSKDGDLLRIKSNDIPIFENTMKESGYRLELMQQTSNDILGLKCKISSS